MFSIVWAIRINNKIYGLASSRPQRRSGPIFRMQSVRTVSRRNLLINWSRFLHFLNPHSILNKLIGGFFYLPAYWSAILISSSETAAEQVKWVSVAHNGQPGQAALQQHRPVVTNPNKNDCGRHTGSVLHHRQVFFPSSDTLIGQDKTRQQQNNNLIPKAEHRFCTMV